MNKSIVIIFWTALIFAACTSKPKSYIIEGVVPDDSYNNQMVYMYDLETRKYIDSTLVVDRKFTFVGSADTAVIRSIELKRLFSAVILENVKLFVNMVDMDDIGNVTGTPLNDELSKYEEACLICKDIFMKKAAELQQKPDIDEETLDKLLVENAQQMLTRYDSLHQKFFHAHKNDILGAHVLSAWKNVLEFDSFISLYEQSGDVVRKYKPLKKYYDLKMKVFQTAEGMLFTDFTIENGNLDGCKVSLSDYVGKGKYVLVDFWASWCGPCIAEIPVLVEVYNKYKGNKFEILGVAVSDKLEASLKSLETHNVPWPQMLNAGDIPLNLYGISGIPHIILFGPDGKIIARNLRGDGLKAKVAEVIQ